jgi:DNA-binding NtrC family response regulator
MIVPETKTTPKRLGPAPTVHRLVVLHAEQRSHWGRVFLLSGHVHLLGRVADPSCFALEDPQVSRRHAALTQDEDGAWHVADEGSRNGTFVNGERLSDKTLLRDQDVVRVGSHLLLFQTLDERTCRLLLEPPSAPAGLVAESPRMLAVHKAIRVAACTQTPVLILGETGVGKERVAAAIHEQSNRGGPLLAINCGALPADLVESELFGHVSGAFTGATARKGLFSKAQNGTLFLDEIGDMDLGLQKKLLRALATGEIRSVGSDSIHVSNARIIAATNVDLAAAVAEGRFRGDLHARLLAHSIELLPLRARREDILPLARHFCAAARLRVDFSTDAAEALLLHEWPYNVRELEQIVAAAAPELASRARLDLSDLPDRLQVPVASRAASEAPVVASADPALLGISRNAVPNRDELVRLLEIYQGNMSHVAKFLGRGRRQVYRWAERYSVDPTRYRGGPSAADDKNWSSATRLTSPPPSDADAEPRIRSC